MLNNYHACLNPIRFASYSCPSCNFYREREFIHKDDYDRMKNVGKKVKEHRGDEDDKTGIA